MKAVWLVPPGLSPWQRRALDDIRRRAPKTDDVVWALSSGTQSVGRLKCLGLDRAALEVSARAVNKHLGAKRRDRWLVAIPEYHVGGYMISVRARLSGSRVYRLERWGARLFADSVLKNRISLSSLVPTQIHDLVALELRSPPCLRAIVVGGGALAPKLYRAARALGWPVLPSYGLTETGSQVATAELASLDRRAYPDLAILSHAEIELRSKRIFIRAKSLCRWVAVSDGDSFTLEDPRRDGWYATADLGRWGHGGLRVLGRRDDIVKVLGTLVSLPQLEGDLLPWLGACAVLALPDARRGWRLVAVTDADRSLVSLDQALVDYNAQARGPWRIDQGCWVPKLPRTALGKLKKAELARGLGL